MCAAKEPETGASPLAGLGMLSVSQVEALGKRWINIVETLLGAAASDTGRQGLMALLEMSEEQMVALLKRASEMLGPQRYQEIITGDHYGPARDPTGALLTDPQKDDLNI